MIDNIVNIGKLKTAFHERPFLWELNVGRITKKKLRKFNKLLNWIAENGEEERAEIGIKERKYTFDDTLEILRELLPGKYEELTHKPAIKFKKIGKIPEGMFQKFLKETYAFGETPKEVSTASLKIGAFHNDKLVGFITAYEFDNKLVIPGAYIIEDYREIGIAQQLLYKVIRFARSNKYKGVDLNHLEIGMLRLMQKIKKRWDKEKDPSLKIRIYEDEDYGHCADIIFTK